MNWLDKLLGRAPAAPAPTFDPATATVDEIIAESQRLAVQQDAIKAARRELAALIDKKLTGA